MATLGEVMSRDVITIEPFDTIGHAAEKMVAEGVSAIVVSDGGRLIGIVTERDLTRAVAGRVHSSEARVREWMTADPQVVSESTDPVEAVQIMLEGGFRHLPVVENERAVGIVSIRDLAEWSIRSSSPLKAAESRRRPSSSRSTSSCRPHVRRLAEARALWSAARKRDAFRGSRRQHEADVLVVVGH